MSQATARRADARAMLDRMAATWNVPLSAGIEISDRCNEVCVHCYQEQGRKGEMTTEQLFGVLDELAAMGVLLLTLSGGEATLRKDFLQIVAYARRKGFAVRLFTNGLTMTRELANALGELALQTVEISLYSTRPEMHDFVTGVPGSFERTVAGVRNLVAAGVPVTIKTPVMSLNEQDAGDYAELARALGAEYSLSPSEMMPRENGDRFPEAFELSGPARVALLRELGATGEDGAAAARVRPLDSPPCGAGRGIHIEPNGELRPCTMLDFDLGHALREGVAAARASNPRAHAMQTLTWRQLHGCRECDLRPYCEHCYAAALAHSGDALGPYEAACRGAALKCEARRGSPVRIVADVHEARTGPYREREPGVFEPFEDRRTPEDAALAERLGWSRRRALPGADVVVRPGELVQIRRPGRKSSTLERIPTEHGAGSNPSGAATRASGGKA